MHTVVFTNRGHTTDSSFQLDRVQLISLDGDPIINSPPNPTTQAANGSNAISLATPSPGPGSNQSPSSTGLANPNISSLTPTSSQQSATSLGQTVILTQQSTGTGQPGPTSTFVINTPGTQAGYHQVHLSAGAVAGIAIGGLVILALFIAGFFALKCRRNHSQAHQMLGGNELGTRQTHRSIHIPTPFGVQLHPAIESTNRLLNKGNVHSTSVTRPQLEAHQRTARASTNHYATDGDTGSGCSHSHGLNVGQEGSRQVCACEAPPAYQPAC